MKVIQFTAIWCPSCYVMKAKFAQIEKDFAWLETVEYDYDQNPALVQKHRLEKGKLPAFIFQDKKGQELLRKWGEISRQELIKIIEELKDK